MLSSLGNIRHALLLLLFSLLTHEKNLIFQKCIKNISKCWGDKNVSSLWSHASVVGGDNTLNTFIFKYTTVLKGFRNTLGWNWPTYVSEWRVILHFNLSSYSVISKIRTSGYNGKSRKTIYFVNVVHILKKYQI